MGVRLDADGLEPDALDPRSPAGGDEQPLAAQLAAVVEREHVVLAVASRARRVRAEDELDAVAAQDLAERLAQRGGLAREHVSAALDEHDLAAEPAYGLRHLDADRAAAEDDQPARDGRHGRRLAIGPDAVELAQPGDRRDHRVGAARDDDVLGGVTHPVDLDRARPGEPAGPSQQRDAVVREPALLPGVGVVGDHEVAPGQGRVDVHLRGRGCLARACTASPGRNSVLDGMHAQ